MSRDILNTNKSYTAKVKNVKRDRIFLEICVPNGSKVDRVSVMAHKADHVEAADELRKHDLVSVVLADDDTYGKIVESMKPASVADQSAYRAEVEARMRANGNAWAV